MNTAAMDFTRAFTTPHAMLELPGGRIAHYRFGEGPPVVAVQGCRCTPPRGAGFSPPSRSASPCTSSTSLAPRCDASVAQPLAPGAVKEGRARTAFLIANGSGDA